MAVTAIDPQSARHAMASRPDRHVWVAASAGTGKTSALVDRITRLLLAGEPPESLVAITFTRTAAAEMQTRVLTRLAGWVRMEADVLAQELERLGEEATPARMARARSLFARLLEAPGGLRVETIHALAQGLLAAFPLEAGLAPGLVALDERGAADLRQQAFAAVLRQAGGDRRLEADLGTIAVAAGEALIEAQLAKLAGAREAYAGIGGTDAVDPWLRHWLGLPGAGGLAEALEAAVADTALEAAAAAFARALEALDTSAKLRDAAALRDWLAADPAARRLSLPTLTGAVLTSRGLPRKFQQEAAKVPAIGPAFDRLLHHVLRLLEIERGFAFVTVAGAWLRVGIALAGDYARRKAAAAAIDYDDMIAEAARLLAADGMLSFVNWKLDRHIRHVLVDEAQDTNAAQWALVEGLSADFDSGEGAHGEARRTRFVVGDFKQAIYGFQGTDPRVFAETERRWAERATGATPFETVPLDCNFRSAALILRLVDRVLKALGPEALGLGADAALRPHVAARAGVPGRVLLLPPFAAAGEPDGQGDEDDAPASPAYARALADLVDRLVRPGSPERLVLAEVPGRRARRFAGPGDVLILVQARADLMAQLVAALHRVGLPVAGVDRMLLMEPLAVRDLLSVMRFVVQPADDLALAEVLTSPLGGLDHEALRAVRVSGQSLWQEVRSSTDARFVAPRAFLDRALSLADQGPPHAFLSALLDEAGGRRLLLARLGRDAEDGLDALLAQALAFEASGPATLAGFLRWLGDGAGEVKRDPESGAGEVRIMTVHGAKGLQAPIVVLADATRGRRKSHGMVELPVANSFRALPLIYGSKDRCPAKVGALAEAAEAAARAERNRLLYVAMTRAEDMLVVAGEAVRRGPAEPNWHGVIADSMRAMGAEAAPDGALLLADPAPEPPVGREAAPAAPAAIPAWALVAPAAEPAGRRPFTPSAAGPDDEIHAPPSPAQRAAALRGSAMHRLFERLPDVPPPRRPAVGERILRAAGVADIERALEEVLAILDDSAFSDLFGPESLSEAPVAGRVDGRVVSGIVDRLVVTDARVLILDFKTGLVVPETACAAQPTHLRQLAAYRAVLRQAFPGRRIEAGLLFTAAPKLLLAEDKLLDRHWPAAAS